jgi:hypothetical protein
MNLAATVILVFGGWISLLNFYLSFLRRPLHQWRRPTEPYRFVSGLPLLGFLLLCISAALFARAGINPPWVLFGALVLFDTGGPVWLVGVLIVTAARKIVRSG